MSGPDVTTDMSGALSLQEARRSAQTARRLAEEHRWAHRDTDPGDAAVKQRNADLERAAVAASTDVQNMERALRAGAAARRREADILFDAGLQARLRAEAQARRDVAAPPASPMRRRSSSR